MCQRLPVDFYSDTGIWVSSQYLSVLWMDVILYCPKWMKRSIKILYSFSFFLCWKLCSLSFSRDNTCPGVKGDVLYHLYLSSSCVCLTLSDLQNWQSGSIHSVLVWSLRTQCFCCWSLHVTYFYCAFLRSAFQPKMYHWFIHWHHLILKYSFRFDCSTFCCQFWLPLCIELIFLLCCLK